MSARETRAVEVRMPRAAWEEAERLLAIYAESDPDGSPALWWGMLARRALETPGLEEVTRATGTIRDAVRCRASRGCLLAAGHKGGCALTRPEK